MRYADWDHAARDLVEDTLGRIRQARAKVNVLILYKTGVDAYDKVLDWLAEAVKEEHPLSEVRIDSRQSKSRNERMCRLLHEATGARFRITRDGEHCFINGYTATTLAFVDYVKEYVPKCMSRKLAFLDHPDVQERLRRSNGDAEAA